MKRLTDFHPETGINIVCLIISAGAPAVAIGPIVGVPTGTAIALGLLAVIRAQRSASGNVRSTYYFGAWVIRVFSGAFEVMAYTDVFGSRASLPFDLSPTVWAWVTALFMAALDLWALQATAARARAAVEVAEQEESLERADRLDREKHERKQKEEADQRTYHLELARIQADTAKAQAQSAAEAQAEVARAQAEADRKRAEAEAEAQKAEAEARRKQAEAEAEAARTRAEAERQQAEARRKEAEEKRKAEAAQRAENERLAREAADRQRAADEAERKRADDFRKQQAEAETEAEALRRKWQEASPEVRTKMITEAEAALRASGQSPTRDAVGRMMGVSGKTVQTHVNTHCSPKKQAA